MYRLIKGYSVIGEYKTSDGHTSHSDAARTIMPIIDIQIEVYWQCLTACVRYNYTLEWYLKIDTSYDRCPRGLILQVSATIAYCGNLYSHSLAIMPWWHTLSYDKETVKNAVYVTMLLRIICHVISYKIVAWAEYFSRLRNGLSYSLDIGVTADQRDTVDHNPCDDIITCNNEARIHISGE